MIDFQKLSSKIESLLKEHKTPSVQLSIIENGEITHEAVFGYKDIENKISATKDTVYAIGSATKPMLATAIAKLVSENKLSWDEPVKKYYPSLRLYDKYAEDNLTIRDILCHRSGLPRHDLVWFENDHYTSEELMETLQYLKPSKPFRYEFQYQNLMYALAGHIIEKVTGEKWYEYLDNKILKPIGAYDNVFKTTEFEKIEDSAKAYQIIDDSIVPIERYNFDNCIGAAGSMCSSSRNIAKVALLHLNGGSYNGEQIIPQRELQQCHTPHIPLKIEGGLLDTGADNSVMQNYGLGWFIEAFNGHKIVHHGGNINGYSSMIGLVPKTKSGFVFLTNLHTSGMQMILTYTLFEMLTSDVCTDWNSIITDKKNTRNKFIIEACSRAADYYQKNTVSPLPFNKYTGKYKNKAYGEIDILYENDILMLKKKNKSYPMEHLSANTFGYRISGLELSKEFILIPLQFNFMVNGQISGLSLWIEPGLQEGIVYDKIM